MPSIFVEGLSARLQRLVAAPRGRRAAVEPLTPAEIGVLTAAARQEPGASPALPAHRALSLLAQAADPAVSVPVLAEVARDLAARPTDRVAALRGLARVATADAQPAFQAGLRDPNPRVEIAAIAAIGETASTREQLGVLDAAALPQHTAVQRQLTLSRALIAHRLGLDGPFLPERRGVRREAIASDRMRVVTLAMKSAETTAEDLAKLVGSTYAIPPAPRGYDLRCGRARWTVFGNAEIGQTITASPRLFERPWILAIAARWQPPATEPAVQYLVLSRPAGRAVHVDVVRTDGEIAYTGTAEPIGTGTGLSFTISDVERPGTAPTTLDGMLDVDTVRLDVAILHDDRLGTRPTQPTRSA